MRLHDSTMVDVAREVPDTVIALPYAGPSNAFGRPLYPLNRAFLRTGTARLLARAQALLRPSGLRLVVWDAYRPLSVQKLMWEALPDDRFVAPPGRGSRHNRGAAVDVTLCGALGNLEMPTAFDDFGPRAHADCQDVPAAARRNRDLLRAAMFAAGFTGIDEEWWHFDDPAFARYPLCDLSLHELAARSDAPPAA